MKQSATAMPEYWQLSYLTALCLAFALVFVPDLAFALTGNTVAGNAICDISDSFTGEVATGVGTIAVCTVGTMACLGRIQWSTAVLCAVGVALLFGTGAILSSLAAAGGNTVAQCA